MTQLMFAIANNPHPRDPRAQRRRCRRGSRPIIDKALAKDFEQRYQTGAEFAEAIRQARKSGRAPRRPMPGLGADGRARAPAPARHRDPRLQARGRPVRHRGPPRRHASRTTSTSPRACVAPARPIHGMWLRITVDRQLTIVDAAAAMDAMPYVGDCDRDRAGLPQARRARDPARLPPAAEGALRRRARLHPRDRARRGARHRRVPDHGRPARAGARAASRSSSTVATRSMPPRPRSRGTTRAGIAAPRRSSRPRKATSTSGAAASCPRSRSPPRPRR